MEMEQKHTQTSSLVIALFQLNNSMVWFVKNQCLKVEKTQPLSAVISCLTEGVSDIMNKGGTSGRC